MMSSDQKGERDDVVWGYLFTEWDVTPVTFSRSEAAEQIALYLEGEATIIQVLSDVEMWVNLGSLGHGNSQSPSSRLIRAVLQAVAAGKYAASDEEERNAQTLLLAPDAIPASSGPCLVLGPEENGEPPEAFLDWIATMEAKYELMRGI